MKMTINADQISPLLDLFQRLLLWIALAVLLFSPGWVPLLDRFIVETTEINLFGQKIKVTDKRSLNVPGLEITKEGRVLLNGQDISLLPGEIERLRSENELLTSKLKDTSQKLDQAASASGDQKELEQLAQSTREVADRAQAATARQTHGTRTVSPEFAVILSSDTTLGPGGAADEIKDARGWAAKQKPEPEVRVFLRNGYYATSVIFYSRDAAQDALLSLRKIFQSSPYVADLRSWCPASQQATPVDESGTQVIDCGF
jgi:hypothetical protein